MREVLPGRREERRVRRAEEREHVVAAERAEKANAAVEIELGDAPADVRQVRPVAGDEQRDVVDLQERGERHPESLLLRDPPRKREHRPLHPEPRPSLVAARKRRKRRRRVRQHRDPLPRNPPLDRKLGEVATRTDEVAHTAKRAIACPAEQPHA